MQFHLPRRVAGVLAVLGIAAVPALAPGVAAAGEPGTTWDPAQIIHCAVLEEELDGYEQERNEALAMGDDDAARYYDQLAQENMAEQVANDCDATPMPGGLPGQMIDDVRETVAPQLKLDHVDRGSDVLDRGGVLLNRGAAWIDPSVGLVAGRP